jgi:hypothetical protein
MSSFAKWTIGTRLVGKVLMILAFRAPSRPIGAQDLEVATKNRAPHLFNIEPGTYVIETIKIGSGAVTVGPGYDTASHNPRFGIFVARPGEIVNLGRLIVHMHWHEGFFDA